MKPTLRAKLDSSVGRLEELNRLLAAEDATKDLDQFKKLSREHAELTDKVALYGRYRQAERDAEDAKAMAAEAGMKTYADEELKSALARMAQLEAEVQKLLLPKDPNDERNTFLEVRAGAGGDESGLFAGELFRIK